MSSNAHRFAGILRRPHSTPGLVKPVFQDSDDNAYRVQVIGEQETIVGFDLLPSRYHKFILKNGQFPVLRESALSQIEHVFARSVGEDPVDAVVFPSGDVMIQFRQAMRSILPARLAELTSYPSARYELALIFGSEGQVATSRADLDQKIALEEQNNKATCEFIDLLISGGDEDHQDRVAWLSTAALNHPKELVSAFESLRPNQFGEYAEGEVRPEVYDAALGALMRAEESPDFPQIFNCLSPAAAKSHEYDSQQTVSLVLGYVEAQRELSPLVLEGLKQLDSGTQAAAAQKLSALYFIAESDFMRAATLDSLGHASPSDYLEQVAHESSAVRHKKFCWHRTENTPGGHFDVDR